MNPSPGNTASKDSRGMNLTSMWICVQVSQWMYLLNNPGKIERFKASAPMISLSYTTADGGRPGLIEKLPVDERYSRRYIQMALKTAFLIFDGAAELDIVAPWEVFDGSKWCGHSEDSTYTVALTDNPVTCLGGLKIIPDFSVANAPSPDILVVPGTADTSPLTSDGELLNWILETSKRCTWTVGICTGTVILAAAGVANGKRVTTHWDAIDSLRTRKDVTVLEKVRYVRDGNLLTSAGVSAGLDMALWLVGQIYGASHAREVQHLLEYYPAPPYAAEV